MSLQIHFIIGSICAKSQSKRDAHSPTLAGIVDKTNWPCDIIQHLADRVQNRPLRATESVHNNNAPKLPSNELVPLASIEAPFATGLILVSFCLGGYASRAHYITREMLQLYLIIF
ncbi:hypothetical protein P8452_39637 [Trifolium repens]|nr:hypothetical protein P8452_39637 [Trifolium repens]